MAAYDLQPWKLKDVLSARNVTAPGGEIQTQSRNVLIDPTADFKSTQDIGNVLVAHRLPECRFICAIWSTSRVPIRLPPAT